MNELALEQKVAALWEYVDTSLSSPDEDPDITTRWSAIKARHSKPAEPPPQVPEGHVRTDDGVDRKILNTHHADGDAATVIFVEGKYP